MSPVPANRFLHYELDAWMRPQPPSVGFCRYADDAVIYCISEADAVGVEKTRNTAPGVRASAAPGEDANGVLPGYQSRGHVRQTVRE